MLPAGAAGWEALDTLIWTGVLTLMPLLNRDHLRAGDMVAGTWVIAMPKTVLLPDVATVTSEPPDANAPTFSKDELDAYGIFELQTLETVLRREGADTTEALRAVGDRIRKKIGRPPARRDEDPRVFLDAYYAALRAYLEERMLFGVRRQDKRYAERSETEGNSKGTTGD